MKIRINRWKVYRWNIVLLAMYVGCLLLSYAMAASGAGLSLAEYVRSRGVSARMWIYMMPLLGFAVFPLVTVREYRIDETGIALIMPLGRKRSVPWEGLAFVGPAYIDQGRFRQKNIVYSRELPRKGDPGEKKYVVNGKTAYVLLDSPEMREALRCYCPVYTEEYENVT